MNKSKGQLKQFNNTVIGINRSLANKSTAKTLNTFPKAPRFQKTRCPPYFLQKSKTEPACSIVVAKVRFPTIPKSERTFYFDKDKETSPGPSPNSYQIKDQRQIWRVKRHGDAFGSNKSKTGSIEKIPGPTDYEKPPIGRTSFNRSSTFHKSLRDTGRFFEIQGKDSPGPKYPGNSDFKKTERKYVRQERHKEDSKQHLREKLNRFSTQLLEKELVVPRQTSEIVVNVNSCHKPTGAIITSAKRNCFSVRRTRSPGPGQYVSFSEFSGWAE